MKQHRGSRRAHGTTRHSWACISARCIVLFNIASSPKSTSYAFVHPSGRMTRHESPLRPITTAQQQKTSLAQQHISTGVHVHNNIDNNTFLLRNLSLMAANNSQRSISDASSNDDPRRPDQSLSVSKYKQYPVEPKVYPQRWTQLVYLSLLALLSDWICFSLAASPSSFANAYPNTSAADLIDIFLFTNVASCFLVTDVVARFGLGTCIKGAAAIMTVGCLLRSGLPEMNLFANAVSENDLSAASAMTATSASLFQAVAEVLPDPISDLISADSLTEASRSAGLEPYPLLVLGTILVGFAQPYFQCTPPMLSATWFASNERATATATALNFNQIGIAIAFLVGGHMAKNEVGIHDYFGLITILCALVTLGTFLQFEDKPPSPPSYSEIEKMIRGEKEPPFLVSVKKLFGTPGFSIPLAAFICSISITNIVGTFIDEVMERGGITSQLGVDLAGAGFEFAILLGGIIIGGYVDETKQYKSVTLACLAATMLFVIPLGLTDHMLGNEPVLLVLALLGLGLSCGPIQPINAELAVDVTYPSDETAVESVQQVGGNLVSALLVPVAEWALKQDYEFFKQVRPLDSDIRGDVVLLFAIAAATIIYFSTFDSPLRRTMADSEEESGDLDDVTMDASIDIHTSEDKGTSKLNEFVI